jgi:hypothetical protein
LDANGIPENRRNFSERGNNPRCNAGEETHLATPRIPARCDKSEVTEERRGEKKKRRS